MDANGGFGDDPLDPGCYSDMLFADEISDLEADVTWLCNTSFGFNSNNNNSSCTTTSSQKMLRFEDYATKTGQKSGFTCMDSDSLSSVSSNTMISSSPSSNKRNGSGIQNPGPCPGAPIGNHRNCKKPKSGHSTHVTGHAKVVKKEKLGERITALQQLVSPFGKVLKDQESLFSTLTSHAGNSSPDSGPCISSAASKSTTFVIKTMYLSDENGYFRLIFFKTDTASVLHEALGYIKFLQDQVQVLCSPFLQRPLSNHLDDGDNRNSERRKKDLRSRGLCLIPVELTLHVAESVAYLH